MGQEVLGNVDGCTILRLRVGAVRMRGPTLLQFTGHLMHGRRQLSSYNTSEPRGDLPDTLSKDGFESLKVKHHSIFSLAVR